MDWVRFNRAMQAMDIAEAEQIGRMQNAGKLKQKDIDPAIWERIKQNNILYQERYPPRISEDA